MPTQSTTIRLPVELRERLEKSAKAHKRSLTAEIEYMTEMGLELENAGQARETARAMKAARA